MIHTYDLYNTLQATGGFTVAFDGARLSHAGAGTGITDGPTTGYVVSCDPEHTRVRPADLVTDATLALYLLDKAGPLSVPGKYAGAWLDTETGRVHLDVVTVVDDRDKALELARTHDEIAVWHIDSASEIRTDEEV